jgi:hypothetical protein
VALDQEDVIGIDMGPDTAPGRSEAHHEIIDAYVRKEGKARQQ